MCHQHSEGAATEAGPLLTIACGEVLGTGPALDAFKGPLSPRTAGWGVGGCALAPGGASHAFPGPQGGGFVLSS